MPRKTGVMICGHGSRDADAIREFALVADGLRARLPQYEMQSGFLEFARPVIGDGLDRLRTSGHDHILAVPGMLFAAGHAKNDIPSVLRAYEAKHPHIRIEYARELGIHAKLLTVAELRIRQALGGGDGSQWAGDDGDGDNGDGPSQGNVHDTLLMVVGRGASDPDANANVAKVMRLLWEGMGFGWGETCYSGVSFPLVAPGLRHAARLGYQRIVVLPWFLFTGVLVKRIYAHTDKVAAEFPHIEFIKAPYLGAHSLVLDVFAERVLEIADGANNMNCKLCKYRTPLPGFEDEVGLAQQSHHHHVEGIGVDEAAGDGHKHSAHDSAGHEHRAQDGHDTHAHHGHGHGHAHGHSHHPYPHADHPLGPRSS